MQLRSDVVVAGDDESVTLEDLITGFRMEVSGEAAPVIRALVRGSTTTAPAESVAAIVPELQALGLCDEGLNEDEIRRRQSEARRAQRDVERFAELRDALAATMKRVPWHARRLAAAGVELDELVDDLALQRVPAMTKRDYRAGFPNDLLAGDVDLPRMLELKEAMLGGTSGTSDERVEIVADDRAGMLPDAVKHEMWGLPVEARLGWGAVFTTPVCAGVVCHLGDSTMAERTQGRLLTLNSSEDVMSISKVEVEAIAAELRQFTPDILFVNPWYLVCLLRRAHAEGIALHRPTVVLSGYQLLTRRHARLITEGTGAPVFSYYSASELGGWMMGTACKHGAVHVREDDVHLEVVEDVPGAPPGVGRVVVTTKQNRLVPLVRYVVGDLARFTDEPCPCGMGTEWRTIVIEGREKDALISTSGALVTTRTIDDAVGAEDVDFYQLVQRQPALFTFEAMSAAPGGAERAAQRIAPLLGPGAVVQVKEVRRFSPERSLKYRLTARVGAQ